MCQIDLRNLFSKLCVCQIDDHLHYLFGNVYRAMSKLLVRELYFDVIAVLFALSSATMGFASNAFAAAIVFQFLMSCVNDLSVSLINELIATSLRE